jgi:hypothetical protein
VTKQLLGCCPDSLDDHDIRETVERALLERHIAPDADRVVIVRGLLLSDSDPRSARPDDPLFGAEVVVHNRYGGLLDASGRAHLYAVRPARST